MSAYGIEGLDDEEAELARIAAKDADESVPREDTGYRPAPHPTQEPRGPARKVGALFYTVVERERCEPNEAGDPVGEVRQCAGCDTRTNMLHGRGDDARRRWCGRCVGDWNRDRVDTDARAIAARNATAR